MCIPFGEISSHFLSEWPLSMKEEITATSSIQKSIKKAKIFKLIKHRCFLFSLCHKVLQTLNVTMFLWIYPKQKNVFMVSTWSWDYTGSIYKKFVVCEVITTIHSIYSFEKLMAYRSDSLKSFVAAWQDHPDTTYTILLWKPDVYWWCPEHLC